MSENQIPTFEEIIEENRQEWLKSINKTNENIFISKDDILKLKEFAYCIMIHQFLL